MSEKSNEKSECSVRNEDEDLAITGLPVFFQESIIIYESKLKRSSEEEDIFLALLLYSVHNNNLIKR